MSTTSEGGRGVCISLVGKQPRTQNRWEYWSYQTTRGVTLPTQEEARIGENIKFIRPYVMLLSANVTHTRRIIQNNWEYWSYLTMRGAPSKIVQKSRVNRIILILPSWSRHQRLITEHLQSADNVHRVKKMFFFRSF